MKKPKQNNRIKPGDRRGKCENIVARNYRIARDHLAGLSTAELAGKHNISQRQVRNVLSDESIKKIMEDALRGLALATPAVASRLLDHVDSVNEHVSLKAIGEFGKFMGMTTPHAPVANTLIVHNEVQAVVSPEMSRFLSGELGNVSLLEDDAEVIEAESVAMIEGGGSE